MTHRAGSLLGHALLIGAFALHALVVVLFHFRWDKLAMATVFPVWIYAIAALGMLLIARFLIRTRWIAAAAMVWLITLPFLADEATCIKNLPMGYHPESTTGVAEISPYALRLITINARNSNTECLSQVATW